MSVTNLPARVSTVLDDHSLQASKSSFHRRSHRDPHQLQAAAAGHFLMMRMMLQYLRPVACSRLWSEGDHNLPVGRLFPLQGRKAMELDHVCTMWVPWRLSRANHILWSAWTSADAFVILQIVTVQGALQPPHECPNPAGRREDR